VQINNNRRLYFIWVFLGLLHIAYYSLITEKTEILNWISDGEEWWTNMKLKKGILKNIEVLIH
jgi:hypothetical protein